MEPELTAEQEQRIAQIIGPPPESISWLYSRLLESNIPLNDAIECVVSIHLKYRLAREHAVELVKLLYGDPEAPRPQGVVVAKSRK